MGCSGLSDYNLKGHTIASLRYWEALAEVILVSVRSAHDLLRIFPPLFSCCHRPSFLTGAIAMTS